MLVGHSYNQDLPSSLANSKIAFGGTLSSYTWICMIINFLQTRPNPILPNLHDKHLKQGYSKDDSSFADNVEALSSFGQKNRETIGDLLFAFFRFYAYEFDYENLVISIRQGAQISKKGKNWHLATNNRLCVEEPFSLGRNLANTADDFSWRGLHLELRRAFDLISQTKLGECCEQYTIPKVQISSTTFERPTQSKKPVIRSASQSNRGGRGNHRGGGGRHGNSHGRNSSNNRRASSGQYDNPNGFMPAIIQPNMTPQEQWLQQQAQAQLHNDLYATYSVLQAQESNLRMQLYNQSRQYLQTQGQPLSQAPSHVGSPSSKQQNERNRTSSFDQAPLSAPIRPQDLYYYPLQYPASLFNAHSGTGTSPSSPSLSNAAPDYRRSGHRNGTNAASSSSQQQGGLRSHSQPAQRSNHVHMGLPGLNVPGIGPGMYQTSRQTAAVASQNLVPDPSKVLGEPYIAHTASSSPDDHTPREYWGYYVGDNRQPLMPIQIPAYGESKPSRRSSIDKLQQSVRDRLQRSSRSPSPLGHDRSNSMNNYHVSQNSSNIRQSVSSNNLHALNNQQGPVVVNGSGLAAPISIPQWQASMYNNPAVEDPSLTSVSASMESLSRYSSDDREVTAEQDAFQGRLADVRQEMPMVVNGSNPTMIDPVSPDPSPLPLYGVPQYPVGLQTGFTGNDTLNVEGSFSTSPNTWKRSARQLQNGVMSPLDISLSQSELTREDLPFLSPVYETRTPSPSANRKFDHVLEQKINGVPGKKANDTVKTSPTLQRSTLNTNQLQSKESAPANKANGHTRNAKSEGGSSSSWQKAGGKKKKAGTSDNSAITNGQSMSEKMPHKESERKGG